MPKQRSWQRKFRTALFPANSSTRQTPPRTAPLLARRSGQIPTARWISLLPVWVRAAPLPVWANISRVGTPLSRWQRWSRRPLRSLSLIHIFQFSGPFGCDISFAFRSKYKSDIFRSQLICGQNIPGAAQAAQLDFCHIPPRNSARADFLSAARIRVSPIRTPSAPSSRSRCV